MSQTWRLAKRLATLLWRDERGQSTTEYILILSVVVMIAMKFREKFAQRVVNMSDTLGQGIEAQINSNLGGGGN